MLEIGEDSYIDVAVADNYIENYYAPNAPIAVHWSILTDREKESYLRRSMAEIEALKYTGTPYNYNQALAFPRRLAGGGGICAHYPRIVFDTSKVPKEVENAQVENALGIVLAEISSITDKQFMTLQTLGAIKNTKYNKREAGDIGFGDELKGGVKKCPLTSEKAYKLISGYIGGGYKC